MPDADVDMIVETEIQKFNHNSFNRSYRKAQVFADQQSPS